MLILKLTIVPLALLLFSVIERRHGPRVAGWLSGFPIVAGPLLIFLSLEHGTAFGSAAALGAWFGMIPWLAFSVSYAFLAQRLKWFWCVPISFGVWAVMALVAMALQGAPRWADILPFAVLLASLFSFPRGKPSDEEREHVWWGTPARMIAGAALTVAITRFAAALGSHWSGVFTTFPLMGSIIAISSHVQYGKHAVMEAVAGMSMGLASVGTFCFAAYLLLGPLGLWPAFGLSVVISTCAHALTWLLFKRR